MNESNVRDVVKLDATDVELPIDRANYRKMTGFQTAGIIRLRARFPLHLEAS